jgi:hypothetical protein
MSFFKVFAFAICLIMATRAFSYGTGVSTYPWTENQKIITAEMTGITSTGPGVGMQARYTQRVNDKIILDGGAGLGFGERTNRIFVSSDYEIFPDYMNQPRFSLKGTFENAQEFKYRSNRMLVAPTVSKGFNVSGSEIFPYLSLPVGLSLMDVTRKYETIASAAIGASGKLPLENYDNLYGSTEISVGLKDTFTAVFLGVSYQL